MTLSGYNLNIVSGSGKTDDGTTDRFGYPNGKSLFGLGNLIIGYNATGHKSEPGHPAPDVRTGSHNLILGDQGNYSGFGGILAGQNNTITDTYASVSGGRNNIASGDASSISGGDGLTHGGFSGWTGGPYHTP